MTTNDEQKFKALMIKALDQISEIIKVIQENDHSLSLEINRRELEEITDKLKQLY